MSKYIDSEKLIAGIKHLQEKFPIATYAALYHLITSLQKEQPEVDLEKETLTRAGCARSNPQPF